MSEWSSERNGVQFVAVVEVRLVDWSRHEETGPYVNGQR